MTTNTPTTPVKPPTVTQLVLEATMDAPRELAAIYATVLAARPGLARETIRARIYEHVNVTKRIMRVAEGVYLAVDGPARMLMLTGDAWATLPHIPSESIDLVVTDAPFDLGTAENARIGTTRPHRDQGRQYEQRDLDRDILAQFYRVLKKTTHAWRTINREKAERGEYPRGPGICVLLTPPRTEQTAPHIDALHALARSVGFTFVIEQVVDYTDKGMGYWLPQRHWLLHVFRAGPRVGVPWDLSITTCFTVKRIHRASKTGTPQHEAEKPVDVFLNPIRSFTQPGDVVLDPFAGRARWSAPALAMGRHVILIEKEQRWPDTIATEDWPA